MIKVYGVHGSPFVRRVVVMLSLKGLDYKIIPQMPFVRDEAYLKINPLGKIPSLVDDDLTLCDSKVICRYLENAYPDPALYPTDPKARARADWYEEITGTTVSQFAAGIFFQRFMRPFVLKQDTDETLVQDIITTKLPPMLEYLESELPEHGFIFGDFSMTDMSVISPFINASYANYTIDRANWPKLAALFDAVCAEPSVTAILTKEKKAMGLG